MVNLLESNCGMPQRSEQRPNLIEGKNNDLKSL